MKLILFTLIFSFSFSSSFSIEGMRCGSSCVNKVKSEMVKLDGVKNCSVDFNKSVMTVDFDKSKLDDSQIISHLSENTSYKASILNLDTKSESSKSLLGKMMCGVSSMFGFCTK